MKSGTLTAIALAVLLLPLGAHAQTTEQQGVTASSLGDYCPLPGLGDDPPGLEEIAALVAEYGGTADEYPKNYTLPDGFDSEMILETPQLFEEGDQAGAQRGGKLVVRSYTGTDKISGFRLPADPNAKLHVVQYHGAIVGECHCRDQSYTIVMDSRGTVLDFLASDMVRFRTELPIVTGGLKRMLELGNSVERLDQIYSSYPPRVYGTDGSQGAKLAEPDKRVFLRGAGTTVRTYLVHLSKVRERLMPGGVYPTYQSPLRSPQESIAFQHKQLLENNESYFRASHTMEGRRGFDWEAYKAIKDKAPNLSLEGLTYEEQKDDTVTVTRADGTVLTTLHKTSDGAYLSMSPWVLP